MQRARIDLDTDRGPGSGHVPVESTPSDEKAGHGVLRRPDEASHRTLGDREIHLRIRRLERDAPSGARIHGDATEDAIDPVLVDGRFGSGFRSDELGTEPLQACQCVECDLATGRFVDRAICGLSPRIEIVGELVERVPVEIGRFQAEPADVGTLSVVGHRHSSIRTIMYFRARASSPRAVETGMSSSSEISS